MTLKTMTATILAASLSTAAFAGSSSTDASGGVGVENGALQRSTPSRQPFRSQGLSQSCRAIFQPVAPFTRHLNGVAASEWTASEWGQADNC